MVPKQKGGRRDERSTAGDGREQQHRRAVGELGIEPGEQADVLSVDEDVEEGRDAVAREDAILEARVLGDERVERPADGGCVDRDRAVPGGLGTEHRRDSDLRHHFKR